MRHTLLSHMCTAAEGQGKFFLSELKKLSF